VATCTCVAPRVAQFSAAALALGESVTHGTKARVDAINVGQPDSERIVDLGIGTLDLPVDARIDESVAAFTREDPHSLHGFAPVRGFQFVRSVLSARIMRLHGVAFNAEREILITPGGIKGALTIVFHTFLDPGDEVLVPVPNWPHYKDMLHLHGAVMRPIFPSGGLRSGLTPSDLEEHLTANTRMLILGDCINPTGKVYSTGELRELSTVVARHNARRRRGGMRGIEVVFDCPYESYVYGLRPLHLARIDVELPFGRYPMRDCTVWLSGPGKTYGMHGDRLGYVCARPAMIDMAARVQVNTNSFASTYAQVAGHRAFQADMDMVAQERARTARETLETVAGRLDGLNGLDVDIPEGGYFLFVDFSACASRYAQLGCDGAASFLLQKAGVATIDGRTFADGQAGMEHFVRVNCGRSWDVLDEACTRIERAVTALLV
jgi:aspartate aminotransferase